MFYLYDIAGSSIAKATDWNLNANILAFFLCNVICCVSQIERLQGIEKLTEEFMKASI